MAFILIICPVLVSYISFTFLYIVLRFVINYWCIQAIVFEHVVDPMIVSCSSRAMTWRRRSSRSLSAPRTTARAWTPTRTSAAAATTVPALPPPRFARAYRGLLTGGRLPWGKIATRTTTAQVYMYNNCMHVDYMPITTQTRWTLLFQTFGVFQSERKRLSIKQTFICSRCFTSSRLILLHIFFVVYWKSWTKNVPHLVFLFFIILLLKTAINLSIK